MKIIIIGATGTIGSAVSENLALRHTVYNVGKQRGEYQVDMTSTKSIKSLFERIGNVDAVIAATGNLHFGSLTEMTGCDFNIGLQDKLLGQVNLALIAQHHLNESGSITLTSGIVSHQPILGGANATCVNAAIEAFVKGAAIELKKNIRINAVCPSVITESLDVYSAFFPGYESVPVARVAKAFQRCVEGPLTGQVVNVW